MTSLGYAWIPDVCDCICNVLRLVGTPLTADRAGWDRHASTFVAHLLKQIEGGRAAEEEWQRRCAVFWGGMRGIVGAPDGTITLLQNIPRHVPKATADSYKHTAKSWAHSNSFVVDGEGTFITCLLAVSGRASDDVML